jgi:membrane protease YdiL (CAAX protease family)
MCLYAPIVEETVFRLLLTAALLPTLGERWTIVASGAAFAIVHILRGNPGPDNLIAGFMLEWAFLRSGTILVPLAFHAGGNLIALTSHVVIWYVLGPA